MTGNGTHATTQDPLFNTAMVARLHQQLGVLIAAANFAVNQLAPYEQNTETPRAARALNVLREALDQVTT